MAKIFTRKTIAFLARYSHFCAMHFLRFFLIVTTLAILSVTSAHAAIIRTDIRYSEQAEEILLTADAPLRIQQSFLLESPPRLVIDLSPQGHGKGVGLSPQYEGKRISGLRFGQFSPETSRIVIDLKQEGIAYQLHSEGETLKILLSGSVQHKNMPSDSSPRNTPKAPTDAPLLPPERKAERPPLTAQPFPLPTPKPQHLAKDAQKPVIVVDAGHGGKDTGAIGRSGTLEKHVVLRFAQEFRKALLKTGRYRVVLTRDNDTFLFLKERVAVARKHQGSAFMSIHADSNPSTSARGLSVYSLSERASDDEAAALAAQENKSDIIGGMDLSVEDETVANILIDLAQRETNNKSHKLAEYIIASISRSVPVIKNPHRQAGFRVLKAPDIPSVLIEIGFLTNAEDEKRVNSEAHRTKVIDALVVALDRFFYPQQEHKP